MITLIYDRRTKRKFHYIIKSVPERNIDCKWIKEQVLGSENFEKLRF